VKKLLKADSICQDYAQMKKGPVFWLTVYKKKNHLYIVGTTFNSWADLEFSQRGEGQNYIISLFVPPFPSLPPSAPFPSPFLHPFLSLPFYAQLSHTTRPPNAFPALLSLRNGNCIVFCRTRLKGYTQSCIGGSLMRIAHSQLPARSRPHRRRRVESVRLPPLDSLLKLKGVFLVNALTTY